MNAKRAKLRMVLLVGVFAATAVPQLAYAEGLFDFLFGSQQRQASRDLSSYAEPPEVPAPLGRIAPPVDVRPAETSVARTVAYCVRLCDGQNFPMEHLANATPVETCRAMCPASKTKVFFGSAIDHAAAADGTRYADLDVAFAYRKQLAADCTCNGKDASGLAPVDVSKDPTLRPGDIVSTKDGFVAYSGKHGQNQAFTPIDRATVAAELNATAAPHERLARRAASAATDEPGTIALSSGRQVVIFSPPLDLSRQAAR